MDTTGTLSEAALRRLPRGARLAEVALLRWHQIVRSGAAPERVIVEVDPGPGMLTVGEFMLQFPKGEAFVAFPFGCDAESMEYMEMLTYRMDFAAMRATRRQS